MLLLSLSANVIRSWFRDFFFHFASSPNGFLSFSFCLSEAEEEGAEVEEEVNDALETILFNNMRRFLLNQIEYGGTEKRQPNNFPRKKIINKWKRKKNPGQMKGDTMLMMIFGTKLRREEKKGSKQQKQNELICEWTGWYRMVETRCWRTGEKKKKTIFKNWKKTDIERP